MPTHLPPTQLPRPALREAAPSFSQDPAARQSGGRPRTSLPSPPPPPEPEPQYGIRASSSLAGSGFAEKLDRRGSSRKVMFALPSCPDENANNPATPSSSSKLLTRMCPKGGKPLGAAFPSIDEGCEEPSPRPSILTPAADRRAPSPSDGPALGSPLKGVELAVGKRCADMHQQAPPSTARPTPKVHHHRPPLPPLLQLHPPASCPPPLHKDVTPLLPSPSRRTQTQSRRCQPAASRQARASRRAPWPILLRPSRRGKARVGRGRPSGSSRRLSIV